MHITCVGVYMQGQVRAQNGALKFLMQLLSEVGICPESCFHPESIPLSSESCLLVYISVAKQL